MPQTIRKPIRTIQYGGEYWQLYANGEIGRTCADGFRVNPSPQWRVIGAVRFNNFHNVVERYTLADVIANKIQWKHKNGKQRVHLCDYDHGGTRTWMCPTHEVY